MNTERGKEMFDEMFDELEQYSSGLQEKMNTYIKHKGYKDVIFGVNIGQGTDKWGLITQNFGYRLLIDEEWHVLHQDLSYKIADGFLAQQVIQYLSAYYDYESCLEKTMEDKNV